jgi:hypothetical protein
MSDAIVELKAKTMAAVTLRMAGDANGADDGKIFYYYFQLYLTIFFDVE